MVVFMSFPCMSPEGARAAVAQYIAAVIIAKADAGGFATDAGKPKYKPATAQSALDAVCARARAQS